MVASLILKVIFVLVILLPTGAVKVKTFPRVQGRRFISLGLGAFLAFAPMSMGDSGALSEPPTSRTYFKHTFFYITILSFCSAKCKCLFILFFEQYRTKTGRTGVRCVDFKDRCVDFKD